MVAKQRDDIPIVNIDRKDLSCDCALTVAARLLMVQEEFIEKQADRFGVLY